MFLPVPSTAVPGRFCSKTTIYLVFLYKKPMIVEMSGY